jgi:hypothetical protein
LDKIACNPAAGPRERKDFPIDSAFSCKQLQTKNSALV